MANKKVFTNESLATFVKEIKSYVDTKISNSINSLNNSYYTKTEIDTKLEQKSQVQIITWGEDD